MRFEVLKMEWMLLLEGGSKGDYLVNDSNHTMFFFLPVGDSDGGRSNLLGSPRVRFVHGPTANFVL